MNKGHIQAERAEAIRKAMNTGTQQDVENVNRERTTVVEQCTDVKTGWVHRTLSDGTRQEGYYGEDRYGEDPGTFYVLK